MDREEKDKEQVRSAIAYGLQDLRKLQDEHLAPVMEPVRASQLLCEWCRADSEINARPSLAKPSGVSGKWGPGDVDWGHKPDIFHYFMGMLE